MRSPLEKRVTPPQAATMNMQQWKRAMVALWQLVSLSCQPNVEMQRARPGEARNWPSLGRPCHDPGGEGLLANS
eukprot:COSAG02_NODE_1427_length_12664_cov_3.151850_4_plen_74_part_00